jgi:hypothetical protein
LGVAARVAGQQTRRSRTFKAAMGAVRATARSFTNVAHQLWLEVMGVFFFVMAMTFAGGAVREYGKYHAGQAGLGRVAIAILVAATFAWFCVSSFWRVRRKSQRQ